MPSSATAKSLAGELAKRIEENQQAADYQALLATAEASLAAAQAAAENLTAIAANETATAEDHTAADTAAREAEAKAAADRAAAEKAWSTLVDESTTRFALAELKPLSPEQLAWSTMQAVGLVDQQRQALSAEAQKQAAAVTGIPPEALATVQEKFLEELVDKKLAGNINQFVSLFGQQPGQAPSFQATVHQALFLANGGLLAGWLNPGGGNLTERLSKLEDPAAVADELYLTVFTRRPTADEAAAVAEYWAAAKDDRATAAREMVWSLVTSAEFRFSR